MNFIILGLSTDRSKQKEYAYSYIGDDIEGISIGELNLIHNV